MHHEFEAPHHEHHEHHEFEGHHEHHETAHHEAVAEMMADIAARSSSEAEAEAMVGAATMMTITAADRAALRRVLAQLGRGPAVLTRLLRARSATRPPGRAA